MTFHEGKVWAATITFVNDRAAKVTKRVYTMAPDLEKAGEQVKAAMPFPGKLESVWLYDAYDGLVI